MGLAVILAGFLLLGGVLGLAVAPSEFYWSKVYPDGKSASEPLVMKAGTAVQLKVEVIYTGGPSATYWDVYATVTWGSNSQTVDMGPLKGEDSSWEYDDITRTKTLYKFPWWETSWTPPDAGKDYKFTWTAKILDSSGNLAATKTKVSYARTYAESEAPIQPDGTFYAAGMKPGTVSTITVSNPTVLLYFIPTKAETSIVKAYVEVKNRTSGSAAEVVVSSIAKAYTLPKYGTYDLKCYIDWTGGDPLYKAGVTVNYPAPEPQTDEGGGSGGGTGGGNETGGGNDTGGGGDVQADFFTTGRVLGLGLIVFGAVILFGGRRKK